MKVWGNVGAGKCGVGNVRVGNVGGGETWVVLHMGGIA